MVDSTAPPSESVDSYPASVVESSYYPKDSPPPSQTLDRHLSIRRPKVDDHARARMLFDEIVKQSSEPQHEEEKMEVTESSELQHEEEIRAFTASEVLEDSEEPAVSPPAAEADSLSEPSGPMAVDDSGTSLADETDAWISCNRSETEVYKPFPSVASSSSSWYEDAYETPSMVGAGLANLGNTCFFNAVLQCFTHSVLLVQGLYSYTHLTPCDCNSERFCLVCALREHIELSLSSTGKIVSPWKFVDNLSYFSSSFQRFQQEDAHEFLQCFLDRLESSLSNLKANNLAPSSQSDNLVKQVFGGRVVSTLRCCNCNHFSDTYEPSVDLSLEIEDAKNLLTALESFTKVEHIEDEEMKFTCDQCKQKVSVEKQLMLDQTPPICAFHLKRFKNDGSYVEKIDKHVEFPLELDLQPYTCGNQINNVDLKYELYAVVVHAAFTSSCGHYYCYIRSAPDTWYKFDDSKVTKVSEAYVLSEEAYILFYARQNIPWFSNFMETYKPSLDPNLLSNTSPKSVLENMDPDTSTNTNNNNHCNDINESFSKSRENRVEVTGAKDHAPPSAATVPPKPINSTAVNDSNHVTLKEYGSNHKPMFNIDKVFSPPTPPRSPGLDPSDDESSEVVFAAKPNQLKMADKPSIKRQRNKSVDDSAKQEAFRQCKRMPGARGNLLMAALETSSKSENSLNKKSKKMISSPRKNHGRSSEKFKNNDNLILRNLASSSFR